MNLNGIVIFEWGRINNPSLKLMAVFFIHSIIVLITYLTNAINSYRFQMDKSHVTSIFILAPVICLSSSANISWFTSSLGEPFNSCLKRKWLAGLAICQNRFSTISLLILQKSSLCSWLFWRHWLSWQSTKRLFILRANIRWCSSSSSPSILYRQVKCF